MVGDEQVLGVQGDVAEFGVAADDDMRVWDIHRAVLRAGEKCEGLTGGGNEGMVVTGGT
ncbi:hypothetical protein GCM10010214_12900 [Streptomyces abikoensis]|nr:hypothetical protein GCM10010214_12900 [Streptomyces abikoensis]